MYNISMEDHIEVPLEEPDVDNILLQNKSPVTTNKELWGIFIRFFIILAS